MNITITNTSRFDMPVAEPIGFFSQTADKRISRKMNNLTGTYFSAISTGITTSALILPVPSLCIGGHNSVYNFDSIVCTGSDSMLINLKSILKLKSFQSYPDNWNGYGAKSFTAEYLSIVETLLVSLPFEADVFPLSDARVQFEFERDNGAYLEIEINSDNTVGVFELLPDRSEREYIAMRGDVVGIVKDFYG